MRWLKVDAICWMLLHLVKLVAFDGVDETCCLSKVVHLLVLVNVMDMLGFVKHVGGPQLTASPRQTRCLGPQR